MSQSFGQSGFVGSSLSGLNSNGCNSSVPSTLCPSSSSMMSSTLAAVSQMNSTGNMYNGGPPDHMSVSGSNASGVQPHHHQPEHQQHHSSYMNTQGFFQDRHDVTEASIKGSTFFKIDEKCNGNIV